MSVRDALVRDLAFALRKHAPWRRRGKNWHLDDDREPAILAAKLVEHLERCGFVFSRRSPAETHKSP